MSITTSTTDNITRIMISDRFDYSLHNEFRDAYKNSPEGAQFILDMNRTTYLDSSALGMMLLLREYAGDVSSKITITGCNPEITQILEISNFQNLFNIS